MGLSPCPVEATIELAERRQVKVLRPQPREFALMSRRQQVKKQSVAAKSCDRCVHRNICILYHGHGQLELRFGNSYAKDPAAFIDKLDERLAARCLFFLERDGNNESGGGEEE
jgi:hypothetical protein